MQVSAAAGRGEGVMAQAKLAQLSKQWGVAEAVLLAQGKAEEAIQMYIQAYRWDDAIKWAASLGMCIFNLREFSKSFVHSFVHLSLFYSSLVGSFSP